MASPTVEPGVVGAPVTLLTGGDIVTMDADRRVLLGGTIAFAGDRIVAVGATGELLAAHPDATVVDVSRCVSRRE